MDRVTYKNYRPYIVKEFKAHYFKFDSLKHEYKIMKKNPAGDRTRFEQQFIDEILRLNRFISIICDFVEKDIEGIEEGWKKMNPSEQKAFFNRSERSIERALRATYTKLEDLQKFHKFNCYLIFKVAKKYEKILMQSPDYREGRNRDENHQHMFSIWHPCPSHKIFQDTYLPLSNRIQELNEENLKLYQTIFRSTYPELAKWELEFTKSKDITSKYDQLLIGAKMGTILSTAIWLFLLTEVFKSADVQDRFQIWKTLGLYIYSCVGNVLLFKITWTLNVMHWTSTHVNYITIFRFANRTENSMKILNETLTVLVLFCVSLIFFFLGEVGDSVVRYRSLSYICPFSLLILSALYSAYKLIDNGRDTSDSRGLFSFPILMNCFLAPFMKVNFRDVYIADVLTSFSKVIQDGIHGACWILTGSFLQTSTDSDGDGTKYCPVNLIHLVSSVAVLFVLWIRFAQCLRVYYDTHPTIHSNNAPFRLNLFPHGYNALKYLSSMSVIIYGLYRPIDTGYILLICWSTLYKWWWDVVMDWGCCEGFSFQYPFLDPSLTFSSQNFQKIFLRSTLLFKKPAYYYFAIILDLILRFFWVTSLMPSATLIELFGPMFSIYLGSFEILRRSMWGALRVEWEHIKLANKHEIGFRSIIIIGKKDISSLSVSVPITNITELKEWVTTSNFLLEGPNGEWEGEEDGGLEEYARKSVHTRISEVAMNPLSEGSSYYGRETRIEPEFDEIGRLHQPFENFLDGVFRSNCK